MTGSWTRRSWLAAAAAALVPFVAEAGSKKTRRRCPARYASPFDVPGDLRECETPCEEVADCPGDAVACLHNRCRYCPSDRWELVVDNPDLWGGKRCVREGFSELRAACSPW